MTEMNNQIVAQKVRQYLSKYHPDGVTLDVDEQGIYSGEFRWQVPVRPSSEPRKRYEYYEALAEVEDELETLEQLKVFLVPSDPIPVSAA